MRHHTKAQPYEKTACRMQSAQVGEVESSLESKLWFGTFRRVQDDDQNCDFRNQDTTGSSTGIPKYTTSTYVREIMTDKTPFSHVSVRHDEYRKSYWRRTYLTKSTVFKWVNLWKCKSVKNESVKVTKWKNQEKGEKNSLKNVIIKIFVDSLIFDYTRDLIIFIGTLNPFNIHISLFARSIHTRMMNDW